MKHKFTKMALTTALLTISALGVNSAHAEDEIISYGTQTISGDGVFFFLRALKNSTINTGVGQITNAQAPDDVEDEVVVTGMQIPQGWDISLGGLGTFTVYYSIGSLPVDTDNANQEAAENRLEEMLEEASEIVEPVLDRFGNQVYDENGNPMVRRIRTDYSVEYFNGSLYYWSPNS